jgi:D-tagatose-1,6-bisphosphate aldolase subunit GatZ/KbaZ
MKALVDLVAQHRAGVPEGIFAVCSAHPLVIEAALRHAQRNGAPFVLIEATSNQVNQSGGYTGMTPEAFRDFAFEIAGRVGFEPGRIILGGDHLGPNPWTARPADKAMAAAEAMVAAYVAAGFRKIHLDCSMPCADDAPTLSDATVARRAARLCAAAESAWAAVGGEPPVYVIGTEVPAPGGAAESLEALAVTEPAAAAATVEAHRRAFLAAGLAPAWERALGLVVQPGVEFDHRKVVDYRPADAEALSRAIEAWPHLVFEAHSTDYQSAAALARLVRDHFAILKVGPALTFALREALWALDMIDAEWFGLDQTGCRAKVVAAMHRNPKHWRRYYQSHGRELHFDLQYSLSDRIRYYWPSKSIGAMVERLFRNLAADPPPLALISQHLPTAYAAVRRGEATVEDPRSLVMAHISSVLDDYHAATARALEAADA